MVATSFSDFSPVDLAGWAIAIATVLALGWTVAQSRRDRHVHYDWERKQNSLSFSVTRNDNLRKTRAKLDRVFKQVEFTREGTAAIPKPTIDHLLENNDVFASDLVALLGHWENLGLAINQRVADEFVAFEMVATTVRRHVDFFAEFIAERRRTSNRVYKNLLLLYVRWSKFLDQLAAGETSLEQVRIQMEKDAQPSRLGQRSPAPVLGLELSRDALARFAALPQVRPPTSKLRGELRVLVLVNEVQLKETDSLFGIISGLRAHKAIKDLAVANLSAIKAEDFLGLTLKAGGKVTSDATSDHKTLSELKSNGKNRLETNHFDVFLLRIDPGLPWDELRLLGRLAPQALFLNAPAGMQILGRKEALSSHFSDLAGKAQICRDLADVDDALKISPTKELVLKPNEGLGGNGIVRIPSSGMGYVEDERRERHEVRKYLAGQFSIGEVYVAMPFSPPAAKEGDRRLFIVNDQLIGAIDRQPRGDWRANIHRGGVVSTPPEISFGDRAIAEAVIPHLHDHGIFLAGVDTIQGPRGERWLSEINATNPGLFRQLDESSPSQDVFSDIAEALVERSCSPQSTLS